MKKNSTRQIFRMNQIGPGSHVNGGNGAGGSQPPRNRIEVIADIRIMFAYSPRKNRPKIMAPYSTWKPPTISLSPSGRSNGARLVSASVEMKKTTNIGNSGRKNQTRSCAMTMSLRFSDPAQSRTVTMTKPKLTSYDTICAAERSAPRKAYLELLAQPAMTMP